MKYKKIFTFILLLCTIFGTLLFINPNIKAVSDTPPSDLTGTTWRFGSTINNHDTFSYSVNFSFILKHRYIAKGTGSTFSLGYTNGGNYYFNYPALFYTNYLEDGTSAGNGTLSFYRGYYENPTIVSNFATDFEYYDVTFIDGQDITNPNLITWLNSYATQVINKSITFNALNDFEDYSANLQYSFDVGETWQNMGDIGFPTTFNNYNSVLIRNNDTSLIFTISNGTEILRTLAPNEIFSYVIQSNDNLYFDIYTPPFEPEPTYTLNGGFKFNTNFASSNFYSTDIDIDFTNYFPFPYNSGYSSFINFSSITFQQRDNTRAGVMYYRSEYGLTTAWTDNLINGLGFWNNYNNPTLITQFIKFNNVVVSEDIYNWLNSVGTFGDFDYTDIPNDSTGDTPNTSRFQWLINDIDAFMNLEPLPNLSFYDILLVFVSIPLLIYILKLFLGG